jgi:hypothetical protein
MNLVDSAMASALGNYLINMGHPEEGRRVPGARPQSRPRRQQSRVSRLCGSSPTVSFPPRHRNQEPTRKNRLHEVAVPAALRGGVG